MLENSEFKIMIVDDEIFNIEVVIGFLEDEGYTLAYNTNPKKALQRIFDEDFDLILLDINMPELNGLDLCKRLKNDAKTQEIPVIFLSAFSDTKTITSAFSSGGVDYITKPFNGLELIARVNTHIELRRYIKELQVKQEKLAQIVATDSLTGLANRIRFLSILKRETVQRTNENSHLSLIYIKIDNLHKINTLYGYKNGDAFIVKMAKVLNEFKKETSTLARIFGTEFVLLMPKTSLASSSKVAKKILATVRETKFVNLQVTCSIGIGTYTPGEKYEAFLQRVEKLMQEVNHSGGNMIGGSV